MTTHGVAKALLTALAIAMVSTAARHAWSQDHHPLHRDFYRHWMQPGVHPPASCCNARIEQDGHEEGDCEPTQGELRPSKVDGVVRWHAWLRQESRWIEIDDKLILRERNPNGQDAHLCWTPASGPISGVERKPGKRVSAVCPSST
ncbi:MAG: hypothetical protein K9G48_08670 [Reyranella sp.]|nr:hypothetical protein [Reyranella sp.]